MKTKRKNHLIYPVIFLFLGILLCGIKLSYANSDLFPPYELAPVLTSYVSGGVFAHTYYMSPTGNDTTGNGSIDNPWLSFNGLTSGGSGTAVGPGDLVYFRGGTYPTHVQTSWMEAYYALKRSGTSNNYIVITNYPGETPVFEGQDDWPSFSIHGNYVVIDGIKITSGSMFFNDATYGVVQNSTFGPCTKPWGDQITGTCIGINNNVNHVTIRNNYFTPTAISHAVKNYTSEAITSDITISYNRFYGNTVSYGVIANKGAINNWTIAYNRFEDCSQAYVLGTTYNSTSGGYHTGITIHHNVFDNISDSIFDRLGVSTLTVSGVSFHDNVIYNATSGPRNMLMLRCDENGCMNSGTQAMGEFWNNLFYGLVDTINPQTTSNFVNYPSYWNYNAYPSTSLRDTAENQNGLSSSSWQGSTIVAANHGITRTGIAGNRFYYVSDTSSFRGRGRYGDSIGGFKWGGSPYPPMLRLME